MYRKNRQVQFLVYLVLSMLLMNVLTVFPQLDFFVEVKASSESLLGEVEDFALNFACQRKIFYAQGRHWVFYWNNSEIALRTSSDGIIFAGEMIIANVDEDPNNKSAGFAIWNNETHVAYVSAYLDSIRYRLGQLNPNGTITWVVEEQTAAIEDGTELERPNLRLDKNGYPWVIYNRLNTTSNRRACYVSKSQWNNGSWLTAPNFPYKMSSLSTYAYRGMLLELDEGMYAVWYIYADELRGRLWNYTSQDWENEEVGADDINPKRLNAAVTTTDNTIHMTIAPHGDEASQVYYINRTSAGFGSPVLIGAVDTAPPYGGESITVDGNDLYLFWRNTTTTIVSMNRTNGVWGEKFIWKNNERGTRWTGMQSFYESADDKIGVAWVRRTILGSYNLIYEVIELVLGPPSPPIFTDGVESGGFESWDAVIGTPQVSSGDAYNGSYKAVFDNQGDRVRKDFIATSPLHFRFYFRISDLPQNSGDDVMLASMGRLGAGWVQRIHLYNNGTDVVWRMGYYDAWSYNYINSVQKANPNVDTWICVEIRASTGGNAEFQVWIDSSELTDLHLTDMKVYRNIDFVLAGTQVFSYAAVVYEDSFVVDNQYIGQFSGQPVEGEPNPPIFIDDVEGGDFGVWDAVIGTPQVSSGDAYNGTYKAVFNNPGDRVRKDFTATSPLHFRFYFRIDTLPPNPGDEVMLASMGRLGSGWVQRIHLYNNGADVVWRMGYYDAWSYNYINSVQKANPNVDTWVCVEIRGKIGRNDGEYQVWIDGFELTDLHLTSMRVTRDIDFVLAGTQILSYSAVVYEDSFVVDNQYIGRFNITAYPEEGVLGEVEDFALNFACQRKIFYAQGRHWVFYKNGTSIALKTSANGAIFGDELLIADVYDISPRSTGFAIWNNETHVAYASANSDSIRYRLGQLKSDGTIMWVTSEQTTVSESGTQLQRPNLGMDKRGYPWIVYNRLNTTDDTRGCYVSKSHWSNGSWSTAPDFPYELSALSTYAYRGMLLELDEGMYAVWYIYADELRGQLWNYTSQDWENQEVGADDINPKRLNAAVTTTDNTIHMTIAPHSLHGNPIAPIYYINRTSAGFGSPNLIDIINTTPPYRGESITAHGNDLYLFWRNTTTTIVSMNRTNGVWGEKFIWKNNENGTKYTGMQSFYESADDKIGVAWVRGTSSPYNLIYEVIDLLPTVPPHPPIFIDDVEGGDFGVWDAVIGTPQVSSGDAYNGTYKAVFNNPGDRVRKDFTATSTIHFRFYFRIDVLPQSAGDEVMLCSMGKLGSGWVQRIYLYNNGTDVVWRMGYYDISGYHFINSAQQANPSVDTWICVEIRASTGGNAEFQVWIDSSELTDLHLTDMKVYRNIDFVLAGTQVFSYAAVVYEDSFVVDNQYIGQSDA